MQGGFGGMLSIRVRGGAEAAIATAARVSLWKRATSLGGVESLIEHRASIEGADSPCPPDLLRLSAGIEDVEDLWRDLDQALPVRRDWRRRAPGHTIVETKAASARSRTVQRRRVSLRPSKENRFG